MTQRCALCGRLTLHPAAYIAGRAIGPKCARRAGLIDVKRRTRMADSSRPRVVADGMTPDMFMEIAA